MRECFIDGRRAPDSTPLHFAVGGGWFCPRCGVQMETVDGSISCPTCHRRLNEFVYRLVEFNPHPQTHLVFPEGWIVTYIDPSLRLEAWEPKEDLLQLHHDRLNRVGDLGWYSDHFSSVVFQDDFNGQLLGELHATAPGEAMDALIGLLKKFSA